jgi:hypothetical protein
MIITIVDIHHNQQRYETCGDWYWDKYGNLMITVSDTGEWKKNFLIAYHELTEVMLCRLRGVPQEDVDKFDMEYEVNRKPEDLTSEPGDSLQAPYHNEHVFATKMERLMAEELGVNWNDYEESIYNL